jgi:hypothetical protein
MKLLCNIYIYKLQFNRVVKEEEEQLHLEGTIKSFDMHGILQLFTVHTP